MFLKISLLLLLIVGSLGVHLKHNKKLKASTKENGSAPTVKIDDGTIVGRTGETEGLKKPYHAFQGIPYAKPPIGNLRFEPPEPNAKWDGTLKATVDKSECYQNESASASEDCLYINVYTPSLVTKNLPVMVWIHGGAFVKGNSSYFFYGPDYLVEQNVVFVSFNYRLSVFGFLSTGDLNIPGNNGLKDQVLALKWVQKNIVHFGGNPNSVTLFGESAGAASVSYLQLSDLSKGLFHRTILESGSALCSWALNRHGKENAIHLANRLKISNSTKTLKHDLKAISAAEIFDAAKFEFIETLIKDPLNGIPFTPVIEPDHPGAFFTGQAHELISKGKFYQVPSIVGYNSNEVAIAANLSIPAISYIIPVYLTQFDLDHSRLVPQDMNTNSTEVDTKVGYDIKQHYFGWITPVSFSTDTFIRYVSDSQFVRPLQELVRHQAKHTKVYLYKFSFEGKLAGFTNRAVEGVGHTEELSYIFKSPYNHIANANDTLTRSRMVKMWTNFAKTSNPTPEVDNLLQNITWLPAGDVSNNLVYLDIGEDLELGLNPDNKNVKFWSNLYKANGKPPYSTY